MITDKFKNNPYQGGARLADGGLAQDLDDIVSSLGHCQNGIIGAGGIITTDTHTQASGTGGATAIQVDVSNFEAFVNGKYVAETGGANLVINTATCLLQLGEGVYAWVIEKNHGGTVTLTKHVGEVATIGEEVIPPKADILAALADGDTFIRVGLLLYRRTADTTVTEVIDMTYRQPHGVGEMADW